MIVYSRKIIQFILEVKKLTQVILRNEIGLDMYGERFYNPQKTHSYPIKVVIYNNKPMLGYFDSEFYELGFHERLMNAGKEQLKNLIRHELAHYMTFLQYGAAIPHHGKEFRGFCQSLGWGEDVYRATTCLEDEPQTFIEESRVLSKVKKLMALAKSNHQNEAEQAMIKSQQLLLKHHINASSLMEEDEEKVFLKRILKRKKEDAKMRAIATILNTFFVNTVYTRVDGYTYLEIMGNEVNIEVAEYVSQVVNIELDRLWKQAQKQTHLRGLVAKNSFFLGVAKGYCNKIHFLQREYSVEANQMLMVIEKKLEGARAWVYPRLSLSRRSSNYCVESSKLGEKMGRQLTIHSAINPSSKGTLDSISYVK